MNTDKYIEKAIKSFNYNALERLVEVHGYSVALDGEPDTRTLQHIGATPKKLTSAQFVRVTDAIITIDGDFETATEAWDDAMEDVESFDGPVTIMLSIGYADVWKDGNVTANGETLFSVAN